MTRKKIIGFGLAAALVLLVMPVSALAAPEPPAPVFVEPRLTNFCFNADDLDADLIDDGDPDTTDINFEINGTVEAGTATSVDVFEIPPSPTPPIFIGTDASPTVFSSGTWSITLTAVQFAALTTNGHHLLHAFASNSFGTSLAGARQFCIDTIPPAPPTFNPIDAAPGDFTNCVTNPFVMSGTAEPHAQVIVEEQPPGAINGSSFWTVKADSTGAWSINAHHEDLAGNHTVTVLVFQRDGGRNQSLPAGPFSFDVCDDVTPPPAPVITQPTSGGLPSPATLVIAGTAVPDPCGTLRVFVREHSASVDVFADFEATVDQTTGDWSLTQTFTTSGIVFMRAFAVDCAGNMSDFSNEVIKMIDVNAPEARITLPSGFLLADIWVLSSPSFAGTAKDNYGLDHIEIKYVPLLFGTAAATNPAACPECPTDYDDVADPNDSFSPPTATWSDAPTLAPGLYRMEVVAVDLAGNRSRPDTMMVLIVDLP